MNSVSATDTFMRTAVARSSAATVERVDQRRVPEGSSLAGLGERRDDEAVQVAHGEVRAGANANNGLYYYGFAKADTFVRAMYKAGKNPTRQG